MKSYYNAGVGGGDTWQEGSSGDAHPLTSSGEGVGGGGGYPSEILKESQSNPGLGFYLRL